MWGGVSNSYAAFQNERVYVGFILKRGWTDDTFHVEQKRKPQQAASQIPLPV